MVRQEFYHHIWSIWKFFIISSPSEIFSLYMVRLVHFNHYLWSVQNLFIISDPSRIFHLVCLETFQHIWSVRKHLSSVWNHFTSIWYVQKLFHYLARPEIFPFNLVYLEIILLNLASPKNFPLNLVRLEIFLHYLWYVWNPSIYLVSFWIISS